jgi:glycosyltransferase involved in cell wall biosynthesis
LDPKVSIIIPTKNRADYVSAAIQSILNQTFVDFEIIIVDGASIDNTREVIIKFDDKRIRYIREKRDRGISTSRNIGIRLSRGKFVAFLDDDDLWMPSKLEKQLKLISKNPDIGAVSTGAWRINKSGKMIGFRIPFLRGNIFPKILEKNYIGNTSLVLVRKECFKKVGLFDEDLPAGEDFDLWVRLAKYYQFDYVREPLVLYRVHERRISTDPYRVLRASKLLFKKYSKELKTSCNSRKILGSWHYTLGIHYCECGDIEKGKKEFREAISSNPFLIRYYAQLFASFFDSNAFNLLTHLLDSLLWSRYKRKSVMGKFP